MDKIKVIYYYARVSLLILLLISNNTLYAENETEGPIQEVFRSDLVFPQEKGEIQFTAAPYYLNFESGGSELFFPLGIEYGLTDSWQFELEADSRLWHKNAVESSGNSFVQYELSTMYSFMNILDSDFHSALGIEVEHSTATAEETTQYGLSLILAKTLPSVRNAQVFGQYLLEFEEAEISGEGNIGFYLPLGVVTFTSELNIREVDENSILYSTNGLIWAPKSNINAGIGLSANLSADHSMIGIYSIFVYEFDLN